MSIDDEFAAVEEELNEIRTSLEALLCDSELLRATITGVEVGQALLCL